MWHTKEKHFLSRSKYLSPHPPVPFVMHSLITALLCNTLLKLFSMKKMWTCRGSLRWCFSEFPTLNPPPTTLPISSLWVIPVHQPQASWSKMKYQMMSFIFKKVLKYQLRNQLSIQVTFCFGQKIPRKWSVLMASGFP